jgi:hypothetical protein
MTKGFNGFSIFPGRRVISQAALPIVIGDTQSSPSLEFGKIPEKVTLALTKFRKRLVKFRL